MSDALAATLVTAATTVVGLVLAWLLIRLLGPVPLPPSLDSAASLAFSETERARLAGVAKALASTSSGFLIAVLTALVQGKVASELDPITLVLVLLGSVGMLVLAAVQSNISARYMRNATVLHAPPPTAAAASPREGPW